MDIPLGVELFFIVVLILANAFFAASEIAIISIRKPRIKHLIAKNNRKAKILMDLQDDPDRLLATIQIGITLVSTFASAVAGRSIVTVLTSTVAVIPLPFLAYYAETIALLFVVLSVSYLSLVIGELVPKSLALHHTEKIALFTAPFIHIIAKITRPFVIGLTFSKNSFLRLLGQSTAYKAPLVSEEEIKLMVKEGSEKGVFDQVEQQIIQNAFKFTDTLAKEIMTPRFKVEAIEISTEEKEILTKLADTKYSRFLVYENDLDNILGIFHNKDVFTALAENKKINIKKIMYKPTFVPESITVPHLLSELQKNHHQLAVVVNEYGGMEGLVTVEDILEELVGQIRDESDKDEMKEIKKVSDNEFIVDGSKTISDIREEIGVNLPEDEDYDTIAGFMLAELQEVPEKSQQVSYNHMLFTVEKVEENRIAKVKIELSAPKE